jgi:AcrR family transcriptional regulator
MLDPSSATPDRRRTRDATKADLLDATRRLLTGGASVAALSVERIVGEAGMSRATFYLHFSDKVALIAALAESQVAWRDEIGVEALSEPGLRRETLDVMMGEIVQRWVDNHAVLAAIIEVAEYDPDMADAWRTAMLEVAETSAEQFRLRWADGRDAPRHPDTIAELFTWMFERSCHQILRDPSRQHEVAESMAEVIWRVLDYRA